MRGTPEAGIYHVGHRETLLDVAQRYHLGFVEVVAANPGIDPWLPQPGAEIVLPRMHLVPQAGAPGERVVINLAEMRLYYYGRDGVAAHSYAIGIGRDGLATPLGATTIERKTKDPVWRPTARMRKEDPTLPAEVAPGADNPMGSRALYLAKKPYAIHGTNKPFAVGRRISSGCIRMYKRDVEQLYELVRVGTKVVIVDEPIKLGWLDDELYMEAHPTQDQSDELTFGKRVDAPMTKAIANRVRAAAGKHSARLDWDLVRKTAAQRRGYPVRVTRLRVATNDP
jgi:L,D-transpeptidase ErfK/SrfK